MVVFSFFLLAVVGLSDAAWWWEKKKACEEKGESSLIPKAFDANSLFLALSERGAAEVSSNVSVIDLIKEGLGVELIEKDDYILGYTNTNLVTLGPLAEIWTNGAWTPAPDVKTSPNVKLGLASSERKPLSIFTSSTQEAWPKFGEIYPYKENHEIGICQDLVSQNIQIRARLNGDEGSSLSGIALRPCDFKTFDDFLQIGCQAVRRLTINNASIVDPPLQIAEHADCVPAHGARAFDANGTRLTNIEQILALKNYWQHMSNHGKVAADIWFVPSTTHFVWPAFKAGHQTQYNDQDRIITLTTAAIKPAVFLIDSFLNKKEADQVITRNKPKIKPSEVGLVGRAGDRTRTSSNAWDTSSPIARILISRAFTLLNIESDRKLEDGLQVLHYDLTQWYKPHVDYFTSKNGGGNGVQDDAFSNADPLLNNGTNRFATVFLYLSDTQEGGETCFPLSTTHASYQGGRLTAAGTMKTPGFIRESDASWICNTSSEALRVAPQAAKAVLFYSQRGDSSLDPYSLHGSCPVIQGYKWAANLWVWNRPRDALDKAKAQARQAGGHKFNKKISPHNNLQVSFHNSNPFQVHLFWKNLDQDTLVKMTTLPANDGAINFNTFQDHIFIAKDDADVTLATFVMQPDISRIDIPPSQ